MNDIFESWKSAGKFIVANDVYVECDNILLVLTNIEYWSEHYEELNEWCLTHNSKPVGMTVELPDEQTLILFTLKWA